MTTPLVYRCPSCGAFNRMSLLVPGRQAVCGKCKADLDTAGTPSHVDGAGLQRAIDASPVPVLVDFWAPWCAPCRAFAPTFEQASEQHTDVVFAKVNTEEEQEVAGAFNIRSIPTLMVFREKVILYAEAGSLPAPALEQVIAQVKGIDMAAVHREIAERGTEA